MPARNSELDYGEEKSRFEIIFQSCFKDVAIYSIEDQFYVKKLKLDTKSIMNEINTLLDIISHCQNVDAEILKNVFSLLYIFSKGPKVTVVNGILNIKMDI